MSQENVEIVRAWVAAWNARDLAGFMALQHPDVEMTLPRNLLEGGSYQGPEGARRAFHDAVESWEVSHVQINRIETVDDRVVALGHACNVARQGGPKVDYELGLLIRIQDAQVVECHPLLSHAEALKAVGLPE
jgi:ketosteroid isomerase-like protein